MSVFVCVCVLFVREGGSLVWISSKYTHLVRYGVVCPSPLNAGIVEGRGIIEHR